MTWKRIIIIVILILLPIELVADKIPGLDHVSDIVHTAIRPVADYFELLNTDLFSQRSTPDYLARIPEYSAQAFGAIAAMGDDPFWELPAIE